MMKLDGSDRSFLFVPGSRPDRFDKARSSGADVVILDLEDAVDPAHKAEARAHVRAWLADGNSAVVRVNARHTPWWADDMAALDNIAGAVMLPKTEAAKDVIASTTAGAVTVLPLIETARGISHADEICAAEGVHRAAFGSIDYALNLGVDPESRPALAYARSVLVNASAAAGLAPPIDGVTTDVSNSKVVGQDAGHAKVIGFGGKLCIHPRQISVVNDTFRASATEVAWARSLLAEFTGAVGVHDGRMIDAPVLARAQAIVTQDEQRRAPE